MNNTQLKRIIQKIEVDKEGNVEIFLRLFGDLGLDEAVLIEDNYASDANIPDINASAKPDKAAKRNPHAPTGETTEKNILNNHNRTESLDRSRNQAYSIICK